MKKILTLFINFSIFLTACCAEFLPENKNIPEGALKIHQLFFPGEIGDAYIVEAPDGTVSLIDAGRMKVSKTILISALKKRNIKRIDQLIISHFHEDHVGGAFKLLADPDFEIKKIICSYPRKGPAVKSEKRPFISYKTLKMVANINNIPFVQLYTGDTIEFGSDIKAAVVGSASEDYGITTHNGQSLVFKLVYKDFSMLFTGDCSFAEERVILKSGANIRCDVLKSAHHGGAGSNSEEFIDAVGAKIVVTQQPEWLSYDQRGIRVNKILEKRKLPYFRCWEYGDLIIFSDGKTFGVKRY